MALDFFSGFDHLATADLTTGPTARLTAISSATVSTAVARTGTSALAITGTAAYAQRGGMSNALTRVLGFALYLSNVGSGSSNLALAAMGDGSQINGGGGIVNMALTVGSDGVMAVHRARGLGASGTGTQLGTSGAFALSSATWHYIEIVLTVDNSAGVVEVWVNGTRRINITGADTQAGANAYSNCFAFAGNGSATYFDDVYCVSGTGGSHTARLGDVKCVARVASAGDGAVAQFTPSTGTDNGAMVDEATPDGDTTYNAAASSGLVDTYAFAALGITGPILALNLHNHVRKTDAGTCDAEPVARIGGTNYTGTQTGVSQTGGYLTQLYETSPATVSPWTVGEVDGAEFGVRRAA